MNRNDARSATQHNVMNIEEDYVTKCIGSFGQWQAIVFITAVSTKFIAMWNLFAIVFLTPPTEFSCVKFENNDTVDVKNSTCYGSCIEYEFYETVFEKTLISEFGLICENAWLASFTQTVLMFGVLIGAALLGWVSDRYGRRPALIIACSTNVSFLLLASFASDYWTFTILRFFTGISTGGIMVTSIVLILEVIGSKYREAAGSCAFIPDGLSEATLAVFAYMSATWKVYVLIYSMASMFIAALVIFIPESPRWLISKGRVDSAIDVMKKAATWNNRIITDTEAEMSKTIHKLSGGKKETQYSYLDLFSNKYTTIKIMASFFIWIVIGIGYFGITQYVTFLGSNIYVAVATLGLIQLPFDPLIMILSKFIGRRKATISALIATGTSMFLLIFTPDEHIISTIIGVIGMCAASASMTIVYVYVCELFPTSIRNMAYGFCSAGAKLGAMIAPFIASASPQWIPSLILAVFPFMAAGVCLLLPETQGKSLIEEFELK